MLNQRCHQPTTALSIWVPIYFTKRWPSSLLTTPVKSTSNFSKNLNKNYVRLVTHLGLIDLKEVPIWNVFCWVYVLLVWHVSKSNHFFLKYLFIYLWLCWVFASARGPPPVAASGGHSSSRCAGPSLSRPPLLRSTGSRSAGPVTAAHGPSRSAARGILPDQGSNPRPPHYWQADSQPLRHQGSPKPFFKTRKYWSVDTISGTAEVTGIIWKDLRLQRCWKGGRRRRYLTILKIMDLWHKSPVFQILIWYRFNIQFRKGLLTMTWMTRLGYYLLFWEE